MIEKGNFQNLLVGLVDILAVYVSLLFAYYTRVWTGGFFHLVPLTLDLSFYIGKWWLVLLIPFAMGHYGGYSIIISVWEDILIVIKGVFVSFLITWVILSLQKESEMASRVVITLSFVYMSLLIPLARFFLKIFLFKVFDLRKPAFLLAGSGKKEDELVSLLDKEWYPGYRISECRESYPAETRLDVCFMPIWKADEERVRRAKTIAKRLVLVTDIAGLTFMNTEVKTFLSENIAFITSGNGLLSLRKMVSKRIFDILFSILGFLLLAPLFLVIAFFIKLESKGAVFFRHKRRGKGFAEFYMLKFRTMYPDGDGLLQTYLAENPEILSDWEERNKLKEDPRVTGFGRILRKTSLDELPQLLNVIRGEMSIVGPRPDTKEAVSKYDSEYRQIYERVKPGITGLWQVSGRSDIEYGRRVKLDYLYVLNWSLWLDLVIILKTFGTILSGKGAY
jgi:exopolysaccharide biosynthesis polyprenyl glycosylphosphotransferase